MIEISFIKKFARFRSAGNCWDEQEFKKTYLAVILDNLNDIIVKL